MPGGTGGYLPPAIASLLGDAMPMMRVIAEAKATLEEFAETETTATITGDITPLEGALSRAEAEAAAATAKPIEFTVDADTGPALAAIGALSTAARGATVWHGTAFESRSALAGGLSGMFGGLAGVAAAHAASGGGRAGGGGGGGGGLMAAFGAGGLFGKGGLGWGGGFLGMAGIGSILSLAGFGPEHLITTGLGLAGSAAGGVLGGGLLASGALGTMAVGGGSDMAVMKSVMTDTFTAQKSLYNQYAALTNAVLIYGASSAQAAAAQADLNNQMIILGNTAGVQAELGLAKSVDALNRYWDQATSGARIAAVSILSQGVTLANEYIPLVADAAQKNLTIISTGLRPLFAWLGGPEGVGIFNHLEAVFSRNLPTAVDAFNQAVMLVLRTVDVASNYTGHFIVTIDNFLQRMNSPTGFANWQVEIGKLIGLFRDWEALIVIATRDVVDFFRLGSGLGTGIVESLTSALLALNRWETSVGGASQLHALFAAHLQEVLAALRLIYGVIPGIANVYFQLAVPLTQVATAFFQFADVILHTPIIGQIAAYGFAIGIFAKQMALLTFVKWAGDILRFGAAFVVFAGEQGIGAAIKATIGMGTAATVAAAQTATSATVMEASLAGVGASATAASGSVAGLLAKLGGLAAIGGVSGVVAAALAELAIPKTQAGDQSVPGQAGISNMPNWFGAWNPKTSSDTGQSLAQQLPSLGVTSDQMNTVIQLIQAKLINTTADVSTFEQLWGSSITSQQELNDTLSLFTGGAQAKLFLTQDHLSAVDALWQAGVTSTQGILSGTQALDNMSTYAAPLIGRYMAGAATLWGLGDHNAGDIVAMAQSLAQVAQTTGPLTAEAQRLFAQEWQSGVHNVGSLTAEVQMLSAVEQITAPLTAQQMQVFRALWDKGVHDGSTLMGDMLTLQQVMAVTGPLSAHDMSLLQGDLATGRTNASDLQQDLWNAHANALGIAPAADSVAFNLWLASGSAAALKQAIDRDLGSLHPGTGPPTPGGDTTVPAPSGAGSSIPMQLASGGILTEPVSGIGLRSGMRYLLGEKGNEAVVPLTGTGARGGRAGASLGGAPIGGGTTNVTLTSNNVFHITGLPSQIADQVKVIVQENNQQLAAAIGA